MLRQNYFLSGKITFAPVTLSVTSTKENPPNMRAFTLDGSVTTERVVALLMLQVLL
jgi:hypothetical protein